MDENTIDQYYNEYCMMGYYEKNDYEKNNQIEMEKADLLYEDNLFEEEN